MLTAVARMMMLSLAVARRCAGKSCLQIPGGRRHWTGRESVHGEDV